MSRSAGEIRLTESEYEHLRRATETYREELLVRLCGEVGLRATEIPRVRPADVTSRGRQGRTRYFLTVHEKDGTREAYLPSRVAHDFWQYVRSNDLGSDERVIDVSARRIQMLVSAVGRRAAEQTGRAPLRSVTPSVLRRFFARRLLIENGVNPLVVTAIGGWEGVDGLLPPGEEPAREEIAAAFERVTEPGTRRGRTGRLTGLIGAVGRAGDALSAAGSRREIEEGLCSALVEGDTYDGAWMTDLEQSRDRIAVREHAGEDPDRFEGAGDTTLIRQARRTERVLVAPDRPRPGSDQRGLLAAIPVVHGETRYGVLVLRADSEGAFDDSERTLLGELGRRAGLAITAAERRRLLAEDTRIRLTLQYEDAVLADLAAETGCGVTLAGVVRADGRSVVAFVTVEGASGDKIVSAATGLSGVGDARRIRDDEDGTLLELSIEGDSPILPVIERGGTIEAVDVTQERARLVAEFAPTVDVRAFVEALRTEFPAMELRGKQEVAPSDRTPASFQEAIDDRLTEKQQSVLQAAYHAGYFEWPRGSTAEELAESMGISSPTLHNHLRRALEKLLGTAFEE